MPRIDPRIDAYIAKAQPFARHILRELRAAIHAASPQVTETVKWSHPSFEYKGILCGFHAFKAHVNFGFWKHKLVVTDADRPAGARGDWFDRFTSAEQLPSRTTLIKYVKKAMKLNDDGVKTPIAAYRTKRKPIPVPSYVKAALARNAKARAAFDAFPPSHRREYLQWITEAKTDATRERRLTAAIEWMSAGKHRNWQYEK